jgi:hypothetical protein
MGGGSLADPRWITDRYHELLHTAAFPRERHPAIPLRQPVARIPGQVELRRQRHARRPPESQGLPRGLTGQPSLNFETASGVLGLQKHLLPPEEAKRLHPSERKEAPRWGPTSAVRERRHGGPPIKKPPRYYSMPTGEQTQRCRWRGWLTGLEAGWRIFFGEVDGG